MPIHSIVALHSGEDKPTHTFFHYFLILHLLLTFFLSAFSVNSRVVKLVFEFYVNLSIRTRSYSSVMAGRLKSFVFFIIKFNSYLYFKTKFVYQKFPQKKRRTPRVNTYTYAFNEIGFFLYI